MRVIKRIVTMVVLTVLVVPVIVLAADNYGLDTAANQAGIGAKNLTISNKDVPEIIGDVVGVVLSFLGVVFFVLILYAGFSWMTAMGASDKADKAKTMIENAVIGLVIVLAAYAISSFVFKQIGSGSGGSGGTVGSGGESTVSCTGKQEGDSCDINSTCISGVCKSDCVSILKGSCGKASSCSSPKIIYKDQCPGKTSEDNVCCASK